MGRMLLAGFVIVAVWLLVISYWRVSLHMPSTSDVLMYLVLAPVALLVFVFVAKKLGGALLGASVAANADGHASSSIKLEQNAQSNTAGYQSVLTIVSANAITRFGQTADDLVTAISSKKTSFELDAQLLDSHGYPMLSGRIADTEETEAFARVEQWTIADGVTAVIWTREDKRTLALVHALFIELSQSLLMQALIAELMARPPGNNYAEEWPLVSLIVTLPTRWGTQQKQSVITWFADTITQQGWPAEKIYIHPFGELSNVDSLTLIDRLSVQISQQQTSGFYIVLSGHSYVGDQTFSEMQAANMAGLIPGEAAAGMVLAAPPWAAKLMAEPMAHVYRIAQYKRDKSADAARKVKPDTLIRAIKDALLAAEIKPEQVVAVSADTDTRNNRIGELYQALYETVPDMELDADCFKMEASCGALGKVGGLLALVTAWQLAVKHNQPVLCVTNNDGIERSACVIATEQSEPT